ncbi:MAG: thermostable hemolysin [Caulobacteraceae bacterium]|nr:thermostable hemolysin [Caulobacteraceae bacterium]
MLEVTLVDDDGYAGALRLDESKVSRFTRLKPTVISIFRKLRPQRRQVELFLEDAYARAFNGRIRRHYPILMSVWDADQQLHAAAGFRFAATQPLFLEQYLDTPVEAAVSEASGAIVARNQIAEIGNLAAESPGASMFLFFALAGYLEQHGCRYAAATATRELSRLFRGVGFQTHRLGEARPERLTDTAGDWGAYYDHEPVVLAGAIRPAFEPLQRRLAADEAENRDRFARVHLSMDRR